MQRIVGKKEDRKLTQPKVCLPGAVENRVDAATDYISVCNDWSMSTSVYVSVTILLFTVLSFSTSWEMNTNKRY